MSSIDPATMATQLANYDVQSFRQRYSTQSSRYQSQLDAFSKVESALKSFKTTLTGLNSSTSNIIKNSAEVSEKGYFTANADSKALSGNYRIFVEQLATAHQVFADMPANLEPTTEVPTSGTLEFSVNGEIMRLDLTTLDSDGDGKASIADLTSAINNNPDNPGVNATLVRSDGQTHFLLASEETGIINSISGVKATGTGQAWFDNAFSSLTEISSGQDAIIWLGAQGTGLRLTDSDNTFNDAIDGVDITLNKAQVVSDSPLSMKVGADGTETKKQVNNFIESYNKLVTTIDEYSKTKENDGNFTRPVLASDPTLRSIENQVKDLVRREFGGTRLHEIGIEINRSGKMSLDANKFDKAQTENSSRIEELFNGDGNLLASMENAIEPYVKSTTGIFKSRKDALKQNIDRISDKQIALNRKYDMAYSRYLRQFTQMNTIMNQMNQTSSLFG